MSKRILLAFDDPGGGLAVSSVIDTLKENKNLDLKIFSGKESESFVKGFEFKKLQSEISSEEANKILVETQPDLLITGTSRGNAEQELRNAAFKKNLKSVVILDFWKDYKRRWMYASYDLGKMRDIVCVMDRLTKEEMMEEGFPERSLAITGHPYLDKIFNTNSKYISKNYSIKNSILFLSQPLSIIGIKNYKVHPLKILLGALNELSRIKNEKIFLTIKLHPLEKELSVKNELSELSEIVNSYGNDGLKDDSSLKVSFADDNDKLNDIIKKSEVIIGYNTIALFEARAMNKRTISLSFAHAKDSLCKVMEKAGIEIISTDKKNIFDCLMKKGSNKNSQGLFNDGIENCVQVILKELN